MNEYAAALTAAYNLVWLIEKATIMRMLILVEKEEIEVFLSL